MILASALRASSGASAPTSPMDNRWYLPDMGMGPFGRFSFTPDTMMRCSTVLAALRFLATSVGLCRPQIIRYDGPHRYPLPDHYAQRALRRPCPRFTDFEWWELNVVWMSTWGNSYNRIQSGPDSPIGTLTPLEPWRVRVVDAASDGGLIFEYTPKAGPKEILTEDDLLRFPGISIDGVQGAAMYQLMRNVVSVALLAERHAASFLSKGARIGGVLVPEAPLTVEQSKELSESWNTAVGGPDKAGTIAALPFGMKFQAFTQTNQEAQYIELDDKTVGHILRFLNVPGVVVGFADKTATYASADAFFEKGGIKHSLLPLNTRVERRIDHSLIFEPDVACKMNMDALLRADTVNRYAALFRATGRPWMTGNEARAIEDMNPSDDPSMNRVAMPTNLTTQDLATDTPGSTRPPGSAALASAEQPEGGPGDVPSGVSPVRPAPPASAGQLATSFERALAASSRAALLDVEDEEAVRSLVSERARRLATLAAARIVRRELAAVKDRSSLAARDRAGWEAWVRDYYDRHAGVVERELEIDAAAARHYANGQRDALLTAGLAIVATWDQTAVPQLAALAIGE